MEVQGGGRRVEILARVAFEVGTRARNDSVLAGTLHVVGGELG